MIMIHSVEYFFQWLYKTFANSFRTNKHSRCAHSVRQVNRFVVPEYPNKKWIHITLNK